MSKLEPIAIPPSATAVRVQSVTKTYEQWQRSGKGRNVIKNLIKPEKKVITALDSISFNIQVGQFVAYAGPNGAGKSTTMKLLCGMLQPQTGEVTVLGLSPQRDRIELMRRVGVLFGNRTELWWEHPIYRALSGKEWSGTYPRRSI